MAVPYHDTMIDHDKLVGQLLDQLDELGIADDTIVIYRTDNGPHMNTWPDGGMTPFRSEKNTNWEGAFRVPEMIRWPGHIPAGVVSNEIVQHHDWLPTFLAAAGDTTVDRRPQGRARRSATRPSRCTSTATTCCPTSPGEEEHSPRQGLVYFSDDGDCLALRFDNWKVVFMEQRIEGHAAGLGRAVRRRCGCPMLFNLRTDPYERAGMTSNTYYEFVLQNAYLVFAAQIDHDPVPADVRGVPAAAEGGELHHRPGHGEARGDDHERALSAMTELSLWTDGATRSAITDFVARVSDEGGSDYVEPAARVAVFDNDGTLWSEKPLPIQLDFTIRQLARARRRRPHPARPAAVQGGLRGRPALDGRRDGEALPR